MREHAPAAAAATACWGVRVRVKIMGLIIIRTD
jgi:hypothetical protein